MRVSIRRVLALVIALLALGGQVAAGSVVLPGAATVERMAAIDAASVLCGAPHRTGSAPHGGTHHTAPLLAIAAVQGLGALPCPGAVVPVVRVGFVVPPMRPPLRGPPPLPVRAGQPRAPPLPA